MRRRQLRGDVVLLVVEVLLGELRDEGRIMRQQASPGNGSTVHLDGGTVQLDGAIEGVERTETSLAMGEVIGYRVGPLMELAREER